jgi:hypothetical protein
MATWIAHLRIAEHVMHTMKLSKCEEFIVGNIGPDCGAPNEDWSAFTPPSEISHWRDKTTHEIASHNFYETYCRTRDLDFYLGYYVHLVTDYLWVKLVYNEKKEHYKKELDNDPKFIWVMKKDWYDLDKVFLNEHPLRSYDVLRGITDFPNHYFDFYPENAFTRQIQYIADFYEKRERTLTRDFVYLTQHEMDGFVEEASKIITNDLERKGCIFI